jgi:hypothetical protein
MKDESKSLGENPYSEILKNNWTLSIRQFIAKTDRPRRGGQHLGSNWLMKILQ